MTVQCSACKKELREKCAACGGYAVKFLERVEVAPGQFEMQDAFQCLNFDCRKVFKRGYGGVSHGVCGDCAAAALAELPGEGEVDRTLIAGEGARNCRGCWHNDCGFCTAGASTQDICKEYAKGAAA